MTSRSRVRRGLLLGALLLGLVAGPSSSSWSSPAAAPRRIVAIGDLHGDLEATRRVLRLAGAIDDGDRWIGRDLVVVQTGDQLDRGDEERAILDLLERLDTEARESGGAVHALNGNHEIMNAALDFRYVTPGGFADFADLAPGVPDSTLAAYPAAQRGRAVAFRPGGPYARLLSRRSIALVVGSSVFVHGGLLPEHLDAGLEHLNEEVRSWLRGESAKPEWIGGGSPVWARDYSEDPDAASCERLAEVLERLGVDRMIVGHTVQKDEVTSRCDELVWCIDVGLAAHYGGEIQALEIVGEQVRVLREATAVPPGEGVPVGGSTR